MIIASDDTGGTETIYSRLHNPYGVELWSSQDPFTGLSQAMMKSYFI